MASRLFRRLTKHTDYVAALYETCRFQPDVFALERILEADPSAASNVMDEDGNNVLHLVCSNKAVSLAVVQTLLRAHPDAANQSNLVDGNLPLHVAVMAHCSPDVVQCLMDANPWAVNVPNRSNGMMPLHCACVTKAPFDVVLLLLKAAPDAAQHATIHDRSLPLHMACTPPNILYETVWNLAEQWPDAVMARNSAGDTPLEILQTQAPQRKELIRVLQTKLLMVQTPVRKEDRSRSFRQLIKATSSSPSSRFSASFSDTSPQGRRLSTPAVVSPDTSPAESSFRRSSSKRGSRRWQQPVLDEMIEI